MANNEDLARIWQGAAVWNAWRAQNREKPVDLSGAKLYGANLYGGVLPGAREVNILEKAGANLAHANLREADLSGANLFRAKLEKADLSGADLSGAKLYGANLHGAAFARANLIEADLSGANLHEADLSEANLHEADLRWAGFFRANLHEADLRRAKLYGAQLSETNLSEANLSEADLYSAILVQTNLTDADLTGCRIYGISAWDLKLEGAKQRDLVITPPDQPAEITVDNLEVAQFIYLLLNNEKIRNVIDTITSKVVLILGRFTDKRKLVLDELREALRNRNMLPIMFDFSIPATLDVTETIKVLAGLSRFVIADVTDATEVRVELHKIIPEFTLLPVQPILLLGQPEFFSLKHLKKFPWVLPTFEYESQDHLLASLEARVIEPAIKKHEELIGS